MSWLSTWRGLRDKGVLGINRRNRDLIFRHNARRLYPLVDDKLRTKALATEHGVPTPPLYGVLEIQHDVHRLPEILDGYEDFAIKPVHGAGGDGILVVDGRRNDLFRRTSGLWIPYEEVAYHASNVVTGIYSLGGIRDSAMIEYRVRFSPLFEAISYQGVPDVRILVLLGYPVMAMVRLPTRQSEGRGNLHQGAVGVGIDLVSGRTLEGVWGNNRIDFHPDTNNPVAGLTIPGWDEFLLLAARCYELTGLGYIGVDIVLDRDKGPLLLELNARPGLNIQIANDAGLVHRCNLIEADAAQKQRSAADRIALCKDFFGSTAVADPVPSIATASP